MIKDMKIKAMLVIIKAYTVISSPAKNLAEFLEYVRFLPAVGRSPKRRNDKGVILFFT
jgi:hypothetical protein